MTAFIDLNRRFQQLTAKELEDVDHLISFQWYGIGTSVEWAELLEHDRVILLAEAGSGKTREMRAQAERLVGEGRFAFFISLESIKDGFLLESVPDEIQFNSWKDDGEGIAWFFLDSVDELKLTRGKLERALRHLSRAVHDHLTRTRTIISCRPSDWRPSHDLNTVLTLMPVPAGPELAGNQSADSAVRTVLMLPMSDGQIRLFAEQFGIEDASAFLSEVERQDAWSFTRRPLDLIQLIEVWKNSKSLGTRQEQHETNVSLKLTEEDPDRLDGTGLSDEKARHGVERLALAMTLTRKRTLRSPEQSLDDSDKDGTLDPSLILPDWTPAERRTLLRRGMFDPATCGRVRFHHRSVQEYLAARKLRALRNRGMANNALFRFLFTDIYGIDIVFPSMREIASWLALWDDATRRELIKREPEALLSLGDPGSLDMPTKYALLRAFVFGSGEDGSCGLDMPINQVRRFAEPELGPVIRECWGDGTANAEVRNLLLRLIWVGKVDTCADLARSVATDPEESSYRRIVAIRALVNCGEQAIVRDLVDDMINSPTSWPAKVIHGVVEDLFPCIIDVDDLVALIEKIPEPSASQAGGFEWHLPRIVEAIDPEWEEAVSLRNELVDLIWRARDPSSGAHGVHGRRDYLAPALAELCGRQLTVTSSGQSAELIRASVIASRFGENAIDIEKSISTLRAHFATDLALRKAAFWAELTFLDEIAEIKDSRERLFQVCHGGLIDGPTGGDRSWLLEALADEGRPERRCIALHALIRLWRQGGQTESELDDIRASLGGEYTLVAILENYTAPPTPAQDAERIESEAFHRKWHERKSHTEARRRAYQETLCRELHTESAFSPANRFDTLERLYKWMTERLETDGALPYWDKNALAEAFGAEVITHVEEAFQAFWRARRPILWSARPANKKNHVYRDMQIGLLSIKTEALKPGWAGSLTPDEARTAAAYGTLELNKFPSFLTAIFESHPKETEEIIGGEVSEELKVGGDYEFLSTLERLTYADRNLKQLCIPRLLTELQSWPHEYATDTGSRWALHLDSVLRILGEATTEDERESITQQCVDRYKSNPTGPSAFRWLRGIFRFDTEQGADALVEQFNRRDESTIGQYAIRAFASLLDRDRSLLFDIENPKTRARILGKLVRLVYTHVRPEDDIVREGMFIPGSREDAEAVRQHLFEMLLATPGSEAHRVLLELADEETFATWSDRLRMRAVQRAAENAEFTAYSIEDVRILEKNYEAPPSDRDGLFTLMIGRLEDLGDDLAHGDFSDKSTVRSIKDESEMQRTLAGRLNNRANGVYVVTREEEVVDKKKTDIRIASVRGNQKAVIEVKIADRRWSLPHLRTALRQQLVDRYLRDTNCKAGCLLLTCHDKNKYWIHPEARKRIRFHEMVEYLNEEAQKIEEDKLQEVRVSVFGLHLDDT